MRELAAPVTTTAARPRRHRGTGGGRPYVQRLDDRRAHRGGRRRARWPSTATAPRPGCRDRPTCSRRWACGSTSARSRSGAAWTRSASAFMFAPRTSRRDAARHPGAPRAGRPHGVQLPRAPDESGRSEAPADRRVGRRATSRRWPGRCRSSAWTARWSYPRRTAWTRSASPAPTQVVEVNGTKIDSYTVSPEDVGLPATTDPQATAGGDPAVNARITRAILVGEDGPRTRSRRAQRRGRDLRRWRACPTSRRASPRPARRSRTARRRRPSSGSSP